MDTVTVGGILTDVVDEAVQDILGDLVYTVIIVAVLGIVALDLVVNGQALLVADDLDLGILDGGEGIGHYGEAGDAGSEPAGDFLIMQRHFQGLIAVLIVHVVDDVEGIDINAGQPLHHIHILLHDLIIVEVLGGDGTVLRADLMAVHLIHAAVDGVQQALGQVGAGAEELHLLADTHGGYAAGNAVVIAVNGTHDVIVLVLDGRVLDGDLGTVLLPVLGQVVAPQYGQVGLGGSAEVIQGVQITVAHLGDHVTAVGAHAAQALGDPGGIAGEDVVVIGGTGELDQTQLHYEVVNELLDLLLGEYAVAQVTLGIDIEEGGGAAKAHGGAVLLLHGGKIGKIDGLDGFLDVGGGLGDIAAVDAGHRLELLQGTDLLGKLLTVTDDIGQHDGGGGGFLEFLVLDQTVHTVQGNTAVVADDAAAFCPLS